jgi:hypothetical protein
LPIEFQDGATGRREDAGAGGEQAYGGKGDGDPAGVASTHMTAIIRATFAGVEPEREADGRVRRVEKLTSIVSRSMADLAS